MKIIVFDTETTGLLKPIGTSIDLQPYIVEIALMKVDLKTNKEKIFDTLLKPPISIPKEATRVHGITDHDVKNAPTFGEIFEDIAKMFFGCQISVAQNLTFDEQVLEYELLRQNKQRSFPWTPQKFCTIEHSMHIKGHRMKNSELYKMATGKEIENIHRAKNDMLATYENFKYLWKENNEINQDN